MCGIAGEWRFDGAPVDRRAVRAMTQRLARRGPDGAGFHFDGSLGLGHRRLAVVDAAGGAQPLTNEDGNLWLVCNGHVDDAREQAARLARRGHALSTASDCEVILHLYEDDPERFVERIGGMFAFALWDARRRRLVLGRDRFGIKPLYFVRGTRHVRFASQPGALAAAPGFDRRIDPRALADCLTRLAIDDTRSIWRDVQRLPAAHVLVVEADGSSTLRRYHEPPPAGSGTRAGRPAAAARTLVRRLDTCVERALRADGPVGVFLSGGLDSSTLVALASRHRPGLPTFCARIAAPGFDEGSHARLVARHFGTAHHELTIDAATAARALPALFDGLDEPFADASVVPTHLLARFARGHAKAVLGGEGLDELHGGNPWHRDASLFENGFNPWPGTGSALGDLATGAFRRWLAGCEPAPARARRARREDRLRDDLRRYLPADLLHKCDRAGMLAGLEIRVPALSRPFADHATALPVAWRVDGRAGKKLLRRAVARLLPPPVLSRPKRGFALPIDAWLWQPGPFRDLVADLLHSARCRQRGLFRQRYVRRLWEDHARLRALHGYRLWALFAIEAWYRRHVDGEAAERTA
jgi:asparagine synthase (glutamine-hydrolysing)